MTTLSDDEDRAATERRWVLTARQSAQRVRRYLWIESRLFEVLGGWVQAVPEVEVKVLLATHARRHATHADLWRQMLPDRRGHEPDRFGDPPSPALRAFVDALAAPSAPDATVEKLVGVYRVALPQLIEAHTRHLAHTNMVSDRPTVRALELVLDDHVGQGRDGESLLRALAGSQAATERADRHRELLARLLLEAGGIGGDGTESGGFGAGEGPRYPE